MDDLIYRKYHNKCIEEGSYCALIYGAESDLPPIYPFCEYILPRYGNPRPHNSPRYIGFEFGRVYNLFDKFRFTYGDKFSFGEFDFPQSITTLFAESYPGIIARPQLIAQNIRNFHYVNGYLIYGYWIHNFDTRANASPPDNFCDDFFDMVMEEKVIIGDCKAYNCEPGHNIKTPHTYIIGKVICIIDAIESEINAENIMKSWNVPPIPPRAEIQQYLTDIDARLIIDEYPMICFIENMCYCCT